MSVFKILLYFLQNMYSKLLILARLHEGPCELNKFEKDKNPHMLAEYSSPQPYQSNISCKLTFICPADQHVIVTAQRFDLGDECNDYVLFDQHKTCSSRNGRFLPDFVTTQSEIVMHFYAADWSSTLKNGFSLHFGCKGIQHFI